MTANAGSRRLWTLLLVASSLLLLALIFSDALPWLRGPAPGTSEWYWPYLLRPLDRWWPALLSALFMWLLGAWWLAPETGTRRRDVLALLGLFTAAILLQLGLIYADRPALPEELIDRSLSNLASGYFEPAVEIADLDEALRSYPALMPTFASEHAQTHPPGLIIANWLAVRAFDALPALAEPIAAWVWPARCIDLWLFSHPASVAAALGLWSVLPLLFAASSVFFAFLGARRLLSGRSRRLAVLLVASLPALLLFSPKSVQFYAPLALLLFWLFDKGLRPLNLKWLVLSGVLLSLLTFLSLGNAALLFLLLLYALLMVWRAPAAPRPVATAYLVPLAAFAVASAGFWLLYWAGWGVPPWAIAQTGLRQHYALVTNLRRYEWWIGWNLVDLLIFSGWPLFLGFAGGLWCAVRRFSRRPLAAVDALALVLLALVLVLNFSGSARGEVGRLWLFFMPLLTYPAARFWQAIWPGRRGVLLITALQLLFVLALGFAWRPVRAVIVVAERPDMPGISPAETLDVQFAAEPITLKGFTVESGTAVPGGQLDLTLFWQAAGTATRPYTTFNQLLDAGGHLIAQQDNWPVNGQWPPTCWRAGDQIVDPYTIPLPDTLAPGRYRLISGLYDAATEQRLLTAAGQDAVVLTDVEVQEP